MEELKEEMEGVEVNHGNYVDEVEDAPPFRGVIIKMNEGYGKRVPPEKVTREMKEHGYYFLTYVINKCEGDTRELFEFVEWDRDLTEELVDFVEKE